MCINLLLHKKLSPNSTSLNCKHLFIMISVGQEFRSHLARCSDSGSLEVITKILARIAVMQSYEGLPELKSLLGQWLTHMPDKLVLAVGRIPTVLSKWAFPWATWLSFQHGGWLPLERELRSKLQHFFLLPSLKSHTLSFLPYHWLPRSALFSVGRNYKKAWRLKGKNYLWQSRRLDATWGNIRPYRFFIVQSTYPWDSCLYYLSSPQVLPRLNFWRTSSRLSYLDNGSYSILYSSSLRMTTSFEFFCVLHYTKCRAESVDGVQKFLLNNKRLIFVPSRIMWEFQNSKLSQEFSLSYKDKSLHNFQNYLSYL